MNFDGKVMVEAQRAKVWDFLLDVNRFASCVPGVEEVTQLDERTFDGSISARVGPISGSFSFRASIVDSKPPDELTARVEGKDSVTSSTLNGLMNMSLRENAPDRTELVYSAHIEVKGRLAILGDMILRATAALILDEFIRRLKSQLEQV
ncbi:MAG: CoxG family protein [Candidatus Binatia bacterium]